MSIKQHQQMGEVVSEQVVQQDEGLRQDAGMQMGMGEQQEPIAYGKYEQDLPDVLKRQRYADDFFTKRFAFGYNKDKARYAQERERLAVYNKHNDVTLNIDFKERLGMENRVFNADSLTLENDTKTIFGFSGNEAMQKVKRRLAMLQGILRGDMNQFKVNGVFNMDKFNEITEAAFGTTLDALDNYLNTHNNPSSPWGKRRKRLVSEMKTTVETERLKYRNLQTAIEGKAYEGEFDTIQSPQDMIDHLRVVNVKSAKYQNQGNSTDVYYTEVEEDVDGKKVLKRYYMKENLPLINKDVEGFLDRRASQLNASYRFYNSDDEEQRAKEELRMRSAMADDTDYKNGLDLLRIMKNKVSGGDINTKTKMSKRYAEFFRHDFDMLFASLKEYNNMVEESSGVAVTEETLKKWEVAANSDPAASMIYEALKNAASKGGKLEKKTELEWITEKLSVDKNTDPEIFKLLTGISKQEKNGDAVISRLETLFRITMGKEVELYGQMMEGGADSQNEMSQYNTMVTGALATKYNFSDEVVTTKIANAQFKRWDGVITSGTVTLQDVAEGEEWLEVIKKSRDGNPPKEVVMSPNAIRQLMRLQAFDTICLQKDRHGRNFKCKTKEEGGKVIVESIKAYDHDQSFYPGTIEDAFKTKRDEKGRLLSRENDRFLPAPTQLVKRNSAKYQYLVNKYMKKKGEESSTWLNGLEKPERYFDNFTNDVILVSGLLRKSGKIMLMWDDLDTFNGLRKKKGNTVVDACSNEEDKKTVDEVKGQLESIMATLNKFYVNKDEKRESAYAQKKALERKDNYSWSSDMYFKKAEDRDENMLVDVARAMQQLRELQQTYDFSDVRVNILKFARLQSHNKDLNTGYVDDQMHGSPHLLQDWIDHTLYVFSNAYGKHPKVQAAIGIKEPEEFKDIKNENGDIEIPSMLHFDREAYESIKKMAAEEKDIKTLMIQQHLPEKSAAAAVQRAKDMLKEIDRMKKLAEMWLSKMYPEEGDVRRKFFLDRADYEKFDSLDEFSLDPGESYLVQDNKHFMACQKEYQEAMSDVEKVNALKERNGVLADSKRWKDKEVKQLETNVSMSVYNEKARAKEEKEKA